MNSEKQKRKNGKESVFVFDVDERGYQLTSGSRKETFDNFISRFAPKSENYCKYNALSEVRLMFPEETEDVKVIVNIICGVSDIKGNNKYLNESIPAYSVFVLN